MTTPCFAAVPVLRPLCEPRHCFTPLTMKASRKRTKRPRTQQQIKGEPRKSNNAPARINVDSSTPSLRAQLKSIKAARSTPVIGQPVRHTKYRKQKSDAVVWAEKRAKREAAEALPSGKYAHDVRSLCYVDGYNIIGFWPRLRKHRNRGDLEEARRLLVSSLAEFSHIRGWDIVVVFDAYGNDNPISIDRTEHSHLEIVFTGSDTADSFIERAVFTQVEAGKRQIWAVSNDRALFNYTTSKGAHHLSASLFVAELKRAKLEAMEKSQLNAKEESRRASFLQSTVDNDTRMALFELRAKLDGRE